MSNEESALEWLHKVFLKNWKQMISINKSYDKNEMLSSAERRVTFPFIPIEGDGYSLRNLLNLIFKYLFPVNSNAMILVSSQNNDSIVWAAFQQIKNSSIIGLIEFDEQLQQFTPVLNTEIYEHRFTFLSELLKKLKISSELGFYLLINIEVLSEFKEIFENHSNLLEFYARIWDLMVKHFKEQILQIFPEPLFFKFLRRLTTINMSLPAIAFEQFLGSLLPTQNLIITFLEKDNPSGLAISSKQNHLQLQILEYDLLQKNLQRYKNNQENGLEYLNKLIKSTTPFLINNMKVEATAAITVTENFWLMLKDIMSHHSLEYAIDQLLNMSKKVEEEWTVERKMVLFKRWGKSFMSFQLNRLIPSRITDIITSIINFNHPFQTRTCWLIVDDSLKLLYVLGVDFKAGIFNRIYMISDPNLFELFNTEPTKTLAVKKAHFYFADNANWVDQIIVITTKDLNLLISFFPLLTSIKGSLKYLSMIENIITYRMYFYPPNFLADLISRKGTTYFFKNILFPMVLKNPID